MKNKKIKKIIFTVLCLIILLVPCLPMNVFALQEVWFACDKPTVTENSGYVEVVCSQGNFVFVVYSSLNDYSKFYCTVDSSGYLYFYCEGDNGTTIPCYSYYVKQDGKAIETPYWASGNYSYLRVFEIYKINGYNVDISRVAASVPEEPYSFYYAGDVIINDTLQKILGVLSANSGNAQQIINGINSNNNANTDKIIQNQEDNKNEALYGGTDYGDVDGSAVDGYGSAEADLNNATASAQSDSISFLNNFGDLFSRPHLHKGLLAVSAIFKEFFAVNWISDLLSFGLGLGAFGFILGTVSLVVRASGRQERQKEYRSKSSSKNKGGGS